jgi:hypothetical protein
MKKRAAWLFLFTLISLSAAQDTGATSANSPAEVRNAVRAYRSAHEVEIVQEFAELLAIPNRASDGVNIRRNAEHIAAMLRQRGVEAKLLEVPEAPPIVYGDLKVPGARRTLIIYAHYDGQPVDPAQWASEPWTPTLRDGMVAGGKVIPLANLHAPLNPEWRLYARSAGDDKEIEAYILHFAYQREKPACIVGFTRLELAQAAWSCYSCSAIFARSGGTYTLPWVNLTDVPRGQSLLRIQLPGVAVHFRISHTAENHHVTGCCIVGHAKSLAPRRRLRRKQRFPVHSSPGPGIT